MSTLKCCICGRSDVALYRQNEKGVPGIWACIVHDKAKDQETLELTAILEKAVQKPTKH